MTDTAAELKFKEVVNRIINGVNSRSVALAIIVDLKEMRHLDEDETICNMLDLVQEMVEKHGIDILYDPALIHKEVAAHEC